MGLNTLLQIANLHIGITAQGLGVGEIAGERGLSIIDSR